MRFDQTHLAVAVGDGRFTAEIRPEWWVIAGPNGGFLAAVFVAAAEQHVADGSRQLRSLTVHYLAVPEAGPAEVTVTTEKVGRSVHFVSARLHQGGRPIAVALAAVSKPRPGFSLSQWPAPDVPDPSACEPMSTVRANGALPIHENYDIRLARGGPLFAEVVDAELIWWIRPREPQPLGAPLIAAICDATPPPVFATREAPLAVPTVDLSVHVRAELAAAGWSPDDWLLARFRTRYADGGFLEEDGALWLPDGGLLAHSRQLALAV